MSGRSRDLAMSPEDIDQALELQAMRKAVAISRPQLAELLGMHPWQYMDLERAHSPITPPILAQVKDILDKVKEGKLKPNPNPPLK